MLAYFFNRSYGDRYFLNPSDYNSYLESGNAEKVNQIENEITFWREKLADAPEQYTFNKKAAHAMMESFAVERDVHKLNEATRILENIHQNINPKDVSVMRSLARNYISQHRFIDAQAVLLKAEKNGEGLAETRSILSDVYLELGEVSASENHLEQAFSDKNDFHYLIRKAKLADHNGNLDEAIQLLEIASDRALKMNDENLSYWSWSNLGDFYGHAGRIEDSYNAYLSAMKIKPYETYPLYGIAWISFSHLKNYEEAHRILDHLEGRSSDPKYYDQKAQVAQAQGNNIDYEIYQRRYINEIKKAAYGGMYAPVWIEYGLSFDHDNSELVDRAQHEVDKRPVPQSQALLAWAYFHNGELSKAVEIMDSEVYEKCYEPSVLYQMAEIYKADRRYEIVSNLKSELQESIYELGPAMAPIVDRL